MALVVVAYHMALSLPSDDEGPCPGEPLEELLAAVLPADDDADLLSQAMAAVPQQASGQLRRCCTTGDCLSRVADSRLQGFRTDIAQLNAEEKDDIIWGVLRRCKHLSEGPIKKTVWMFGEYQVCRRAWKVLVGIGSSKLHRMCEAYNCGRLQPMENQRKLKDLRKVPEKYLDVDSFFNFLYHNVAEPLADLDELAPEAEASAALLDGALAAQSVPCTGASGALESSAPALQSVPCTGKVAAHRRLLNWLSGRDSGCVAATSTMVALVEPIGERRWLPHMTLQELYEMHLFHGGPDSDSKGKKAKRTLFFRCFYKQGWDRIIKFRKVAQHARCETCARLCKLVRTQPLKCDQKAAAEALRAHRLRNFADRAVDFRLSQLSEDSTTKDGTLLPSRVLHIRIDGMDQAKFRCPRNMDNSKGWETLWRPQLHCVGVIVEGVLEGYFVMDQDVKKNSDMEITILSLALERSAELLSSRGGVMMPEHLSLTYDNTAREGKNQHMAKWMAWLVSRGMFRSVQDGNGQVGHSHNKLDQRFSVVGGVLSRQTCLQTPEDFMTVIQQHVHPAGGRELYVTKLEEVWDWQDFFEPAGMMWKGIAASHTAPDVCHSKRFVRRQDIPMLTLGLPGCDLNVPAMFENDKEEQDDVILLTKEFWSSDALAHPPMLVWNSRLCLKLGGFPVQGCPRNPLSTDQIRQFRKTAAAVKEAPWKLLAASSYLTQWCDQNEAGGPSPVRPTSLCHNFLLAQQTPRRWMQTALAMPTADDRWLRYAPAAPVAITVQPSAACKRALTVGLEAAVAPRGRKVTKQVRPAAIQWVQEQQASVPVGQSTGGAAPQPLLPLPDAPQPVVGASVPAPAPRQLGCPKCKRSPKGCKQCKNPNYKPRGPRGAQAAK